MSSLEGGFIYMNKLGPLGENLAREFLEERGYDFIEANYRTPLGEIDLIMKDKEGLVFVEVKTRHEHNTVTVNDALPFKKVEKIQAAINKYLDDKEEQEWRAELVAVTILSDGLAKIKLIPF